MPRFSNDDLRRRIATLLDRDPDISTARVLRELRQGGISGANIRLRELTRSVRTSGFTLNLNTILDVNLNVGKERLKITLDIFSGEQTVESASHVAINWVARYEATIFFYGRVTDHVSGSLTGRIVQPIDHFSRDLIESRIENAIYGRIVSEIGPGTDSYIDGVTVTIDFLDVDIQSVEPRGRKTRRG